MLLKARISVPLARLQALLQQRIDHDGARHLVAVGQRRHHHRRPGLAAVEDMDVGRGALLPLAQLGKGELDRRIVGHEASNPPYKSFAELHNQQRHAHAFDARRAVVAIDSRQWCLQPLSSRRRSPGRSACSACAMLRRERRGDLPAAIGRADKLLDWRRQGAAADRRFRAKGQAPDRRRRGRWTASDVSALRSAAYARLCARQRRGHSRVRQVPPSCFDRAEARHGATCDGPRFADIASTPAIQSGLGLGSQCAWQPREPVPVRHAVAGPHGTTFRRPGAARRLMMIQARREPRAYLAPRATSPVRR